MIALIIQGNSPYVDEYKKLYSNNINILLIFSTWKGKEYLYDLSDNVIFNKIPEIRGIQNLNLQKTTSLNGLLKAKSIGIKNVIKVRDDCFIQNINKLINSIDFNYINFLFFCNYKRNNIHFKYFVDYIQCGKVDDLINVWNFNSEKNDNYAEYHLTKHIFNNIDIKKIRFIGNIITKNNEIYWKKRNIYLSTYNSHNNYKISI